MPIWHRQALGLHGNGCFDGPRSACYLRPSDALVVPRLEAREAVSLAAGSVARNARRVRWIAQDIAASARALARIAVHARRPDAPVGIGILAGDARALEGEPNVYRIRLVNDTPAARPVVLHLHGETDSRRSFATRGDYVLARGATREIFLLTDWVNQFEITDDATVIDRIASSIASEDGRHCRVVARLESANHPVDEVSIRQPLAACASST